MLSSKNNEGRISGRRDTYVSTDEVLNVSAVGNINTISKQNRTTGEVESKTFFGKPLLPSAF
jgi:hypothetical protein